jgi:stage II sporulation protein D
MGAEGKTYREILSFYYPGTSLGLTAQGFDWTRLGGERLDVLTARPDVDRAIVPRAERALREAESRTGWQLAVRPEVRVYPTVSVYRNATGEPGWVAASTRGHTVRIEPPEVLGAGEALDSTLRHEFLHLLIENHARPGLPLWFREGLVLYLNEEEAAAPDAASAAGPAELAKLDRTLGGAASADEQRSAYRRARAVVARLVAEHGRAEVLLWVERGLPKEMVGLP